jgi:hypothetical protein
VNKAEVLRKLDAMLTKAEQEKTFGCIEVELRGGYVSLIRRTETERIERPDGETTHAKTNYR